MVRALTITIVIHINYIVSDFKRGPVEFNPYKHEASRNYWRTNDELSKSELGSWSPCKVDTSDIMFSWVE